jgi:hypothetical protein
MPPASQWCRLFEKANANNALALLRQAIDKIWAFPNTGEIGSAIAELETNVVYDFLVANADTSLTGDDDGLFESAEIVAIYNVLDRKNYRKMLAPLHNMSCTSNK